MRKINVMYEYIKGQIIEITPTNAVIDCGGLGFNILISLQTYDKLKSDSEGKLFIYHHLREDDEQLYGFATKDERELFKLLISVNGVGVGSARMMLSSLSDEELRNAIIGEDVHKIKSVKGIGLKTAQRIILDLKDKIVKGGGVDAGSINIGTDTKIIEEATFALLSLGFTKANITKIINDILKSSPQAGIELIIKRIWTVVDIEYIIKEALKRL